ncbi:spindle assembly abnormal protein 6 homolog [Agelaius phoeniceus]
MAKKLDSPASAHAGGRAAVSPLSMPDRPSFHSSGLSHPISPLYAFQNFLEPIHSKNGNSQCPVSKVQLNSQLLKATRCSDAHTVPAAGHAANKENGDQLGLESKYFKKKDDSIPLRGLSQNTLNSEYLRPYLPAKAQPSPKTAATPASAYFPGS